MADDVAAWVDYHDTDHDGRVLTLQKFFLSEDLAVVGQRVRTGDHEGNRCFGTVASIEPNGVIAIELDHTTLVRSSHSPRADA